MNNSESSQGIPDARKRKRADGNYVRKRSATACNICRTRKSKCDNERPCGFCLSIGAQCLYEDVRSDFSSYDPASIHIINTLDKLDRQMQLRFDKLSGMIHADIPSLQSNTRDLFATKYPIAEAMLEWPIFKSLTLPIYGRSLALTYDLRHKDEAISAKPFDDNLREAGLDQKVVDFALERFMHNVHSKNPILEPTALDEANSYCRQHGFDNSLEAGLMLIACALGMISQPYVSQKDHVAYRQTDVQDWSLSLAEKCSMKSRAILSYQPSSLLGTSGIFFHGVYEMYRLRPVSAWLSLSQACRQLKLFLLSRPGLSTEEMQMPDGSLVQRLYWSCMQSECELSLELRVESSGLEDLSFPYAFPMPPTEITESISSPGSGEGSENLKSWMYYLSETSLRRICVEVVQSLYEKGSQSWIEDVMSIQAQAEQLIEKLESWFRNLPQQLHVGASPSESTNELGLHIRSRYLMCRTWIFRPFLYFMVHAPAVELKRHGSQIKPLAYLCLSSSVDTIRDVTYHHRHHGTWYTIRLAFAAALSLLAAARGNSIAMPPGWQDDVQRCLDILDQWKAESGSVQSCWDILSSLQTSYH